MIFLTCPHCDETITRAVDVLGPAGPNGESARRSGVFAKSECDECAGAIMIYYSRWRPHVYRMDDVEIDEENKIVTIKDVDARRQFNQDRQDMRDFVISMGGPWEI